ncbi:F-box and WD repeat domain containing protein 10B [Ambystoma mexicanum]|uniref:F-box and WD repeat domain containing protein 10B n=1 Tax=Ambystoma mexicanum TaxID=8296 RepID=UPI0037E6F9E8
MRNDSAGATESLEFRLNSAPDLRCRGPGAPLGLCQACEACVLSSRVALAREWMLRAGEVSLRRFAAGLLRRLDSAALLAYAEQLLQPTLAKDFTYSRSRINPSLRGDSGSASSDRALDRGRLERFMSDTWDWFRAGSYWTKANYVLLVLQLCEPDLLCILANLMRVLLARKVHANRAKASEKPFTEDDNVSIPESHYTYRTEEHPELEMLVQACPEYQEITSDPVLEHLSGLAAEEKVSRKEVIRSPDISRSQQEHFWSGPQEKLANVDSGPSLDDPALMLVPTSFQSLSGVSKHKDFIRGLPVHLSKRILGLLDAKSLLCCFKVSQHWRYLAEEVKGDKQVQSSIQDEAMILQGTSPKGVSVCYAKIRQVPVPKLSEDGETIQKLENLLYVSQKGDLEATYTGLQLETVPMEERNVFCGSYNVMVLTDQGDQSRVIHYNGGRMVAAGSADRKVRLFDISLMKEVLPLIHGHAGSIRAVVICEERGFVVSGSYDLSIRKWNYHTGECLRMFRGHTGTITCLDLQENRLVSGSRDCQVKVWNVESGKCLMTFKHRDAISSVKISGEFVVSGCEKALVKVWHVPTSRLVKTLPGHKGHIKCLSFDQWHLVSGSADGYVLAWSMMGNYRKQLMAFRHPKEVLCLDLLYLRVITGCADGKIRVFNFLNGDCLRVVRVNSQADPVASFCIRGNRIVLNALSSVLIFQFEAVHWDYSIEAERVDVPKDRDKFKLAPFRVQSYAYVRAQRMKRVGSSNRKIYQQSDENLEEGGSRLSHHARSLSARSMKTAYSRQLESQKPASWPDIQNFRRSSAYIDLQPEFIKKPPSATKTGSACPRTPESNSRLSTDLLKVKGDSDGESGYTSPGPKSALSLSEEAALKRMRQRGPHNPMSPDRILLTVSTMHHTRGPDQVGSNMEHNANVRDAWGMPRIYQHFVREVPKAKSLDERKLDQVAKLKSNSATLGLQTISSPFEIKRLSLNLKHSFHSPDVPSSIPVPTLLRSQSCCTYRQTSQGAGLHKRPASTGEGGIRKMDGIPSSAPLQPVRMVMGAAQKALPVKRERIDTLVQANPFRENCGFKLLTLKQMKDYQEEKALEYLQSEFKVQVDDQKKSKKAWLMKVKGLPLEDILNEGKVAAPELGTNIFI